ncbi:MAG: alginate export family protein [Desulfobacteraceae bacterium]|nr:alginate export family protein [Desulfobacteraceae bacterium]
MNFKKAAAIVTAAGALAAISVPAMALENEFHGMYRLRGIMSNFQNAGAPAFPADSADPKTMTVFEQRARLQYTAKVSDDLKLITHFEMDSSWGDNGGATGGRGLGGGMGADSVNLETKNVYLDFNIPSTPVHAKVGIQAWSDAYKGIFINDDLAGAFFDANLGGLKTTAGFARLQDGPSNANPVGQKTGDLYVLDAKYSLTKDLTLGGSYYLYRNDMNYKTSDVHMVGLNAAAKVGPVAMDAFAAIQAGEVGTSVANKKDLLAFAAQVAAKATVGPGALRASFLYASGDNNNGAGSKNHAFQNPAGYVGSSSNFYSSNLLLLMRSVYAMDSDKAIVMTTNNANQGLMLGTLGFDANITDKLGASVNAGFGLNAERNTTTTSNSKYMGTELNASINYKLFANLTATLDGAYVILGDRFKNTATAGATPKDPYMTEVMLNYAF